MGGDAIAIFAVQSPLATFDDVGSFVTGEEADGASEIAIMVVALGLVGERVHLVRRRRQQQNLRVGVVEDGVGQARAFVVGVEKVLESLELIKNHKVWFQVVDRGAGDELAQFADEAVPARSEVAVGSAVRVLEFSCAGFQLFSQRSPVRSGGVRDSVGERLAQVLVEPGAVESGELVLKIVVAHIALEELLPARRPGHG